MNVISLFDGCSCGRVALDRAGIPVDRYLACEIDKSAIMVSRLNWDDITQLGDVTKVSFDAKDGHDLLLGGSPCQGFSFSGKQLNFEDPRSKLFFEFVRVMKEAKPKWFLFENVKMKKEYQAVISEHLGVQPIEINSDQFSAQSRKRLYWTNIPFSKDWIPNTDTVEDILESSQVDPKYLVDPKKAVQLMDNEVARRKIAYIGKDGQGSLIYSIHGKSVTLCGEGGGGGAKTGIYALPCIAPDRIKKGQNGRRFNPPGSKFYTLTAQDRHGVLVDNFIRRLTPVECERLQTLTPSKTYLDISLDNNNKEIDICFDRQKTHAPVAEEKCPKSLNSAKSAERIELKDLAQFATRTLSLNDHLTDEPVQLIVPINLEELNSRLDLVKKSIVNAYTVAQSPKYPHQVQIESFALLLAVLSIGLGKKLRGGKGGSLGKAPNSIHLSYGGVESGRFGSEMPPLVSGAGLDLITLNKLLKYTISRDLDISDQERNLVTLCSYVRDAINGFIPGKTKIWITFEIEQAYTSGVSDSQRYKMLGNGWTVDVIAWILGGLREQYGLES